jgi:hypothetical protein
VFQGGQPPGEGGDFVGQMGDRRWKLGNGGSDFGLALAVPLYDGGFGQVEAAADGGEAQALDAEAEEFVARIL